MSRYLILVFIIMSSCKKHENDFVSLKVINNELHYLNEDSLSKLNPKIDYSFLDVLKARNLITFQLKNNSNSKLLFLMNPHTLNSLADYPLPDSFSDKNIFYSITDENDNKVNIISGDYIVKDMRYIKILQNKKENLEIRNQIKYEKSFIENDIIDYSFLLLPNDKIEFTVQLDLPLITQAKTNNDFNFATFLMFNKVYNFQLYYSYKKEDVKKYLSINDLNFLQKNKIIVFTGCLKSNSIKVFPK